MVNFSKHALVRMSQNALSQDEIHYVITHGQRFDKAGAMFFYLRKRDIPDWDRLDDRWMRLAGTAVILTKDERLVITVWRNQSRGLRHIKRKPRYELTEKQLYSGSRV
ncbi:hypothetical protein ACFLZW_03305 [Chloroflexota bacterium]